MTHQCMLCGSFDVAIRRHTQRLKRPRYTVACGGCGDRHEKVRPAKLRVQNG